MSFLLTNILIGIGLSMDAFSLAIIYGTINISKRKKWLLSSIVALYHFINPQLGYLLGDNVLSKYILNPEILIGFIFLVIALQMLWSIKKEEEVKNLQTKGSLLLFGLTVSIDSFSIGMGFGTFQQPYLEIILSSLIYSMISGLFTYIGLTIGTGLNKQFGKIATVFGSIILIGLSIYYFLI